MSTDEYRGGFCPEPPPDERPRFDGGSGRSEACQDFRPRWEGYVYCVCGIHRSWHKEQKP